MGTAVGDGVIVGVLVMVAVAVIVMVAVGVKVFVAVGVEVAVPVAVGDGVTVFVGDGEGVAELVGVGVIAIGWQSMRGKVSPFVGSVTCIVDVSRRVSIWSGVVASPD